MNNSELLPCMSDFDVPIVWVRLAWNFIALFFDILLMNLLYKNPKLLCGCFDKLYMCTYIAEFLANFARIFLSYLPSLLCNRHFIKMIQEKFPLASVVNGTQWYLYYVIILSAMFFNIDHAMLIIFPKHYRWMCNCSVQWVFAVFCWITPILWILPMFDSCCQSIYASDTSATPIFENSDVEAIYDAIDMTFECFVSAPIIFSSNFMSLFVLHFRFKQSEKRKQMEFFQTLNKKQKQIWQTKCHLKPVNTILMPKITQIVENCHVDEDENEYLRTRHGTRKINTALEHKRILAEFNMSFVTLIDQLNDAVTLLSYLFFLGSNNEWIHANPDKFLLAYNISWELSTTTQPFLLLLICSEVRKRFVKVYAEFLSRMKNKVCNHCSKSIYKLKNIICKKYINSKMLLVKKQKIRNS